MHRPVRPENVMMVDTTPLLLSMRALLNEIGRVNLQLPHKSPSRAALRTLSNQMKEVGFVITGDAEYFSGKNTTPSTRAKRPGET